MKIMKISHNNKSEHVEKKQNNSTKKYLNLKIIILIVVIIIVRLLITEGPMRTMEVVMYIMKIIVITIMTEKMD